jgi:hypothetical protein
MSENATHSHFENDVSKAQGNGDLNSAWSFLTIMSPIGCVVAYGVGFMLAAGGMSRASVGTCLALCSIMPLAGIFAGIKGFNSSASKRSFFFLGVVINMLLLAVLVVGIAHVLMRR